MTNTNKLFFNQVNSLDNVVGTSCKDVLFSVSSSSGFDQKLTLATVAAVGAENGKAVHDWKRRRGSRPGETTIEAGGTIAGPLLQNLTADETLAIFRHPIKGALGADGLPPSPNCFVMRLGTIFQARSQWAGKSVRERSAVEPFAPVMRSDWQAHADHDFEGGGGPLGPVKQQ
jgi:hypothetical protein